MEQQMILARSLVYKGCKINLVINQIQDRGLIYIDGIIADYVDNAKIDQLEKKAKKLIDLRKDGNIFNYRT